MLPLLRIKDLRKEYRSDGSRGAHGIPAVDGVDLEVYPGETLGLIGESGCGKTTLARCAAGLLKPTAGSIEFDGVDLGSVSATTLRQKRRELAVIFQDPLASMDPRMTVEQILREPFDAQGIGTRNQRRAWVTELLDAVRLDRTLADRRPAQLSGGQQQRVVIGRALALKPRLVVADEPFAALDASVQAQILNLLADLEKRYELTVLLVSHSLPVIRYLSTRVAVMYLGRIVEEARAERFFLEPKHPYSQALIATMPVGDLDARRVRRGLAGEVPSPAHPPPGCHFHPRCPHAMPQCRQEDPELVPLPGRAKVRCFMYPRDAV